MNFQTPPKGYVNIIENSCPVGQSVNSRVPFNAIIIRWVLFMGVRDAAEKMVGVLIHFFWKCLCHEISESKEDSDSNGFFVKSFSWKENKKWWRFVFLFLFFFLPFFLSSSFLPFSFFWSSAQRVSLLQLSRRTPKVSLFRKIISLREKWVRWAKPTERKEPPWSHQQWWICSS